MEEPTQILDSFLRIAKLSATLTVSIRRTQNIMYMHPLSPRVSGRTVRAAQQSCSEPW
jgi:hypothetical protein